MKKWLPWIVAGACALWLLSGLRPVTEQGFQTRAFGRLPVLLNGRIQPLDSVARNSLLQIRTKQSVYLGHGQSLTADEWLLEVMAKPETADSRAVFRIDHPELQSMLKLPKETNYFTFDQIKPGVDELEKQARRINEIEDANRTPFEKQVMHLYSNLSLYHRLKNSLQPEDSEDFAVEIAQFQKTIPAGVTAVRAREQSKTYDQEAFNRVLEFLSRYDTLSNLAYPLLVPPPHPEKSRDDWQNVGTALMDVTRGAELPPAINYYASMATAYRQGKPDEFNRAVGEYQAWLGQNFVPEARKGQREFFYNDFAPFYKAIYLYLAAFLLACISFFNLTEWLRRSALYLVSLAWLVHTFGLVLRMVLEGRPPVTNLYSSAIFIGWAAVLIGVILERFFPIGIGILTGSIIGFVTQVIAHNLALGGDTMEMLRAVLDTNFWLATHVVIVTLGYAATFFAGLLAVIYIVTGVFTRSLSANTGRMLARMVYGIICFATLFSFTGTVLGGIWADQSWGRFWGWDPKENGALIIVLWNALILHARWDGMVAERGIMNLAVFGNVVTSFSWFGVNMLGIGLHAYGFMEEAFKWLVIFIVSQLVIIGIGMLPQRFWLSFRSRPPAPVPAPAPVPTEPVRAFKRKPSSARV
jgi:ABC-type transport system involved in cytochrome c biogenesis permease subunit